jgi:hypothetical protein
MAAPRTKPRIDSWDAGLTEAQRWAAYDQFRRAPWHQVSRWIADEYKLRPPGRNALYRWARRMRSLESAHRVEEAVAARDEIGALATAQSSDAALIAAYKAMAADLALQGSAADAVRMTVMAMDLAAAQRKAAELDLKQRAQETRDAALKLARDKFDAAEAKIAAVRDVVGKARAEGGLTPETLKKIEEAAGLL